MKIVRCHIFISGRVQGVSFRWWVRNNAQKMDLTGWVRNLEDGRVEIVAEGEKENLRGLIEFLVKPDQSLVGINKRPPFSKVDDIEVIGEKVKGEFNSFEII